MLGLWAAASRLADSPLLPPPSEVLRSLAAAARRGALLRALGTSLQRLLLGYGLSLVLGVGLGALMATRGWVRDTAGTLAAALQAVPSVCWLPLALLAFGLNDKAIIAVVVLGSLLSIAQATESAVRGVPPLWLRAARTMGASGWTLFYRVLLPAALPGILTGARLGWTLAWRSLMGGELLFVSGGLGQLLQAGRELFDMAQVLGVVVLIALVGMASEWLLFSQLETRVRRRWGLERA